MVLFNLFEAFQRIRRMRERLGEVSRLAGHLDFFQIAYDDSVGGTYERYLDLIIGTFHYLGTHIPTYLAEGTSQTEKIEARARGRLRCPVDHPHNWCRIISRQWKVRLLQ